MERHAAGIGAARQDSRILPHVLGQEDSRVVAVAGRSAGDHDRPARPLRPGRARSQHLHEHPVVLRPARPAVAAACDLWNGAFDVAGGHGAKDGRRRVHSGNRGNSVKITISGASGLIGRRLLKTLAADGHTLQVLSRHAGTNMPGGVRVWPWEPAKGEPPTEALGDADAIIHLAGEPVAQRWTPEVKQQIRESRVTGTANLVRAMAKLPQAPKTLVSASAMGYYGSRGDDVLTESSAPGSDYLAKVCVDWEKAAQEAEKLGVRVVRLRTGIVLDARGGALAKMLPPFKMGVGGKIGSGRQCMSWIHAEDLVGMI